MARSEGITAGADITPDGKQIHIMRGAGTEAFIVDTATNSIVDRIDVGGNSRGRMFQFASQAESHSGKRHDAQCPVHR